MKNLYLLPNAITAFGLSCGLFVIFKMTMTGLGDVTEETLIGTALLLMLAGVADLLDGALARAMHAESPFGGLFDSLADAITFGVAPSVLVLKTLSVEPGTHLSFLLTSSAMVFSICGVLRLVRFSTSPRADSEQDVAAQKNFTGMPIPAAAAAVVSTNLFLASTTCEDLFGACRETHPFLMTAIFFLLGYFMVSRWKYPSFKTLRIRIKSFSHVFITVVATVLLFYGLLHYFAATTFLLAWSYILTGWTLSLIRLIAGSRSKTLVDFEPEPDDDVPRE